MRNIFGRQGICKCGCRFYFERNLVIDTGKPLESFNAMFAQCYCPACGQLQTDEVKPAQPASPSADEVIDRG
jgi:hypothetical protein